MIDPGSLNLVYLVFCGIQVGATVAAMGWAAGMVWRVCWRLLAGPASAGPVASSDNGD